MFENSILFEIWNEVNCSGLSFVKNQYLMLTTFAYSQLV